MIGGAHVFDISLFYRLVLKGDAALWPNNNSHIAIHRYKNQIITCKHIEMNWIVFHSKFSQAVEIFRWSIKCAVVVVGIASVLIFVFGLQYLVRCDHISYVNLK